MRGDDLELRRGGVCAASKERRRAPQARETDRESERTSSPRHPFLPISQVLKVSKVVEFFPAFSVLKFAFVSASARQSRAQCWWVHGERVSLEESRFSLDSSFLAKTGSA